MANKNKRICIILHLYYQNMWKDFVGYLCNFNNKGDVDLFITTIENNEGLFDEIKNILPDNIKINIEVIENTKGADTYPFIHIINKVNLDDYSIVFKIHTKRDINNKFARLGSKLKNKVYFHKNLWREYLLNEIMGKNNIDKCIDLLGANEKIGAVGFMPLLLQVTEKNSLLFDKPSVFYEKIKYIPNLNKLNEYHFFAGTIFAIKANLLKPIQNQFHKQDFWANPDEKFSNTAYFIENLLGYIVEAQGYEFSGTNLYSNKFVLQLLSHRITYLIFKFYVNHFVFKRKTI